MQATGKASTRLTERSPDQRRPILPALTLALALASGAVALSISVLTLISGRPATVNASPLTLSYVIVLPAVVIAATRLAISIGNSLDREDLTGVAISASASLLSAILAARLLGEVTGANSAWVLALVGGWCALVLGAWRAPPSWARPGLEVVSAKSGYAWGLLGILAALTTLAFVRELRDQAPTIAAALVLTGAVAFAITSLPSRRLPRWAGMGADLSIAAIIFLLAPDIALELPMEGENPSTLATGSAVHENFLLAPANDVLNGRGVLIETSSQYGVGLIYALAGWLAVAPAGYGAFGLLSGTLTGLWFAGAYATLRLLGLARRAAGPVIALATLTTAFAAVRVSAFPQLGPLRFGLPLLVVAGFALCAKRPAWRPRIRGALLSVVALSAIWSLEAFAFTFITFAAGTAFAAATEPGGRSQRVRLLIRELGRAGGAVALAIALLVGGTLIAFGELPDPRDYLAYFGVYSSGELALESFQVKPWPPALLVGALYAASAVALWLIVQRGGAFVERRRATLTTLAAMTAYGIALQSYFVGRSVDFVMAVLSLPAFLVAGTWLVLLLERRGRGSRTARVAATAAAVWAGALLIADFREELSNRFRDSALGAMIPALEPDGTQLLARTWHSPIVHPRARQGVRILEQAIPGPEPALVITDPDAGVEMLLRTGRSNLLPWGNPRQSDLIRERLVPQLRDRIESIAPGTRMLTDERALRAPLSPHPLDGPPITFGPQLVPLQQWALREILERFRPRVIGRPGAGFIVLELRRHPRSSSS